MARPSVRAAADQPYRCSPTAGRPSRAHDACKGSGQYFHAGVARVNRRADEQQQQQSSREALAFAIKAHHVACGTCGGLGGEDEELLECASCIDSATVSFG